MVKGLDELRKRKPIIMYALAYRYEDDCFYDFEKEETTDDLEVTCLLPSEALANKMVEEFSGGARGLRFSTDSDFTVVPVHVEHVDKDGARTLGYDVPACWMMEEREEEDEDPANADELDDEALATADDFEGTKE